MEQIYQARLERVQQAMQAQGLDYLFLSISPDLFYLTGFTSFVSERLHLLVIPPAGRPSIVFPDFEKDMIGHLASWIDIVGWTESEDPIDHVCDALAPADRQSPVTIAISDHTRAVFLLRMQAALPQARFVPSSRIIGPLRRAKDAHELQILKEAQALAVEAVKRLVEQPFAGRTEKQVAAELSHHLEAVGFESIMGVLLASGPNGAVGHLAPTDRRIQVGEPVVIDLGAAYEGYFADITRTVHVGPPNGEFLRVFDVVRQANQAALDAIRPGATCESIDRAARRVIEQAGYGEFFTHRLGHGIGIEVHEEPYMVEGNPLPLELGMAFSDEPGIYLPGRFGCRLENIVAVTETGGIKLTEYTHDPIIVA
jgi:Xaa-Pro aminopeptidase